MALWIPYFSNRISLTAFYLQWEQFKLSSILYSQWTLHNPNEKTIPRSTAAVPGAGNAGWVHSQVYAERVYFDKRWKCKCCIFMLQRIEKPSAVAAAQKPKQCSEEGKVGLPPLSHPSRCRVVANAVSRGTQTYIHQISFDKILPKTVPYLMDGNT